VDGGGPTELSDIAAEEDPIGWRDNGDLLVSPRLGSTIQIEAFNPSTRTLTPFKTIQPSQPGAVFARVLAARDGRSLAYAQAIARTHLFLVDGVH
jgi:hypothetical protein